MHWVFAVDVCTVHFCDSTVCYSVVCIPDLCEPTFYQLTLLYKLCICVLLKNLCCVFQISLFWGLWSIYGYTRTDFHTLTTDPFSHTMKLSIISPFVLEYVFLWLLYIYWLHACLEWACFFGLWALQYQPASIEIYCGAGTTYVSVLWPEMQTVKCLIALKMLDILWIL
jgi:hypothetical protein